MSAPRNIKHILPHLMAFHIYKSSVFMIISSFTIIILPCIFMIFIVDIHYPIADIRYRTRGYNKGMGHIYISYTLIPILVVYK